MKMHDQPFLITFRGYKCNASWAASLKGFPSNTPIDSFNPVTRTALSANTITSVDLIGAARGLRVRRAFSRYLWIAYASVTTVFLRVPMKSASGAKALQFR